MSSNEEEGSYYGSRVHQLDSEVLDNELYSLLFAQLRRVFQYIDDYWPLVRDLEPELEALVKVYVWRHTLFAKGTTIGQEMLDLKLYDTQTWTGISSYQSLGLAVSSIGFPYLTKRFTRLTNAPRFDQLDTLVRLLNLLNFVAFLCKGRYRSLVERLLGISCGHPSLASALNSVDYDFMTRELLWHGFAEFLSFVLPIINFRKLKNQVSAYLRPKSLPNEGQIKERSEKDIKLCAVCRCTPTNVTEIGCRHVFCYYCVMSNFLGDEANGFKCPLCCHHLREGAEVREVCLKGF